jgi:hypothetical protein
VESSPVFQQKHDLIVMFPAMLRHGRQVKAIQTGSVG